ncbi:MAG: hypothetical protein GDYSWBUE_000755 [Candidatus Fervidibacterota bacterium]
MISVRKALVGIVMGSKSDWETMKHTADTLERLGIPYEVHILSAHRTPDQTAKYAENAESNGIKVIIAGAGGAAHLAGVIASKTLLPVIGVPMQTQALGGLDSLLSTVQMPAGVPVGTMAIGRAGAINAALFAAAILALNLPEIREKLEQYRKEQAEAVLKSQLELEQKLRS